MPRVNFVSFTFLFAFGLGIFAGIALALLAVALATPEPEPTIIQPDPAALADAPSPTATPTATSTPEPTATPEPVVRTTSALSVRIGPHEDYAVLGTLSSGSVVSPQGRDDTGTWLAINFPPGSSARGWIPSDAVDGISLAQLYMLDILQATLIDTTPRFPFTDAGSSFDGPSFDPPRSTPTPIDDDDSGSSPVAGSTRTPTPTPTSRPPSTPTPAIAPTDLVLAGVELLPGGRVRAVVENLGPGDVPGVTVQVSAPGYGSEVMSYDGLLRAGQTVVLETSDFQLIARALVTIEVDPNGVLSDLDRPNNTLRLELEP